MLAAILKQLDTKEGLRAALCMLPMLIAYSLGRSDVGVPLGQAGFLMAALPLPLSRMRRATNGVIFLTFGLGLYLIGGIVVSQYWAAIVFTFIVSMALSLASGWRLAALLSFTFFSVYTAGLNATSPENLPVNFLAFSIAILWATAISMVPWWNGIDFSKQKLPDEVSRIKTGIRMGIGTSLAFAISGLFSFSKMGWAPSATANIVRFDKDVSEKRAQLRVIGTVAGAIAVGIFFILVPNTIYWVFGAYVITIINGLTIRINKWGYFPFYTTVILILYSLADPTKTIETTTERVAYNIVGVVIAYAVTIYGFPRIFSWVDSQKFARIVKGMEKSK